MINRNLLFQYNALDACKALPRDMLFNLVYLDPPYATGLVFKTRDGATAYDDRYSVDELCAMLAPIIQSIWLRMAANGAMYVHLDSRAVHEAKVMCDRITGRDAFQGEIIWAPGNGARGNGLPSTHQTMLVYANGKLCWHKNDASMREEFADVSLSMHFRNVDGDGRKYRDRKIGGKTYRYYADEGKAIGSIWMDIPAMVANSPIVNESTGYPTQKPEALLERIIRASSNEGDVVADLMCGSGTSLVVAARLGRTFVGADSSIVAMNTTTARLAKAGIEFNAT